MARTVATWAKRTCSWLDTNLAAIEQANARAPILV